ncbi:MAG: ABC transporter substrate-binding protein [Gammaproteobacteria bacterium]
MKLARYTSKIFGLTFLVTCLSTTAVEAALRDEMVAKAKKEGEFVIAGSHGREFTQELVGFRKKYPFLKMRGIASRTADTAARVVSESKAGRVSIDVIDIEDAALESLADLGILEKYEFPHLRDFLPETQPPHGLYVPHTVNARIQVMYNTNLVRPREVPKSWDEMLDPKWSGRSMMAANAEEFPARLAWLWREDGKLNWKRSFAFFKQLAQQKPLLVKGYGAATQRLIAGEAGIFWFPTLGTPVVSALKGAPLKFAAWPKFPATSRGCAIPKGARNPGAAWLFIDYLTSPEGQYEYTDVIQANFPANKKAKPRKLTQHVIRSGVTLEKADIYNPTAIAKMMTDEVMKKSETFFFEIFGLR